MRCLLFFIPGLLCISLHAQDVAYFKSIIDTLSSPSFHGRGYVNSGDSLAAMYIKEKMEDIGLQPVNDKYLQQFQHDINTIPEVTLSLNGEQLTHGTDFLVNPASATGKGTYEALYVREKDLQKNKRINALLSENFNKKVVVTTRNTLSAIKQERPQLLGAMSDAPGQIILTDSPPMGSLSKKQRHKPHFEVLRENAPRKIKEVSFDVTAVQEFNYTTFNVMGMIEGQVQPDSFIFVTAHYDHLGQSGEAIFHGANDNASGVATILDLAKALNKRENLKYSFMFIAFGGEEAGLVGSHYYTEHPVLPLDNIRFLANLDLWGAGSKGLKVVNAKGHPNTFDRLVQLNETRGLVPIVKPQKQAPNSDHYFFSEHGVPAFFLFTLGDVGDYHMVTDTPEKLEYDAYPAVYKLLEEFVTSF